MSKSNLQLCPNCKEGRMQPAGKAEFLGETEEPFREINEARKYECDNCGYIQYNTNITQASRN
ncbi:MAG TPA: hypothetical protein VE544_01350 [Nitrososphaeraceae archaeon]|jgi:hypothetical protein|nr:hypothetical protein [Nitrososphaeraceae archaeon]